MNPALAGLARLRRCAEHGELDALCERHGIQILTAFGSAARGEPNPRDLDVAVLMEPNAVPDYLTLIDDLQRAAHSDLDLVVLNGAGPVLRERALVGSQALYESRRGAWINAATQAVLERMDTEWLRRIDLERMAGR